MNFNREVLRCPVCNMKLGDRYTDEPVYYFCEECQTDFYFETENSRPVIAIPESLRKCHHGCGCGRCGR